MKFAIKYYYGCKAMERASEIILRYEKPHKKLYSYTRNYTQGQRIVLDITRYDSETILEDNIDIWRKTILTHRKMAIKLNENQIYLMKDLAENNIPFFLDTIVDNFEKLSAVASLGVSDVYICNELGFSMKEVSLFCKANDINIRVYPNIAQSSCEQFPTDNLKKFFIRPEDLYLYEEYVDILEFYVDNLDRQNVLYEIYNEKRWPDDLSYIILGLNENISNAAIAPNFGEARLNCKKKCSIGLCATCDRVRDFTKIVETIEQHTNKKLEIRRNDAGEEENTDKSEENENANEV